jgi:hypothetical protein
MVKSVQRMRKPAAKTMDITGYQVGMSTGTCEEKQTH